MHCLEAGSYTVRVALISDTRARLDCLDLRTVTVPVQRTTWGRIKHSYGR